jgi:hypothetical protein
MHDGCTTSTEKHICRNKHANKYPGKALTITDHVDINDSPSVNSVLLKLWSEIIFVLLVQSMRKKIVLILVNILQNFSVIML